MWRFNILRVDGEYLDLPEGSDCSIFQPLDFPSELLPTRDVCYIEVEGCPIACSFEMHGGVALDFEDDEMPEELALQIALSIGRRLAKETGQILWLPEYGLTITL
jgi:hypothetical protein